jgi:phytoene dehydrogenase-like protein
MVLPDYERMGWVLPLAIVEASRARLFMGGQHELIQALWNAFIRAGGDVLDWHEVKRVRVENGHARGVELSDGKTIDARCVVSDLDPRTTFETLLEGQSSPLSLGSFALDEFSIFAVHLALREPPRYQSGGDVNRAYRVNLGLESPGDFDALLRDVRAGRKASQLALMANVSSTLDPVQAHPNRHVAVAWQIAPLGMEDGAAYRDELVERWHEYAPNLTPKNILLKRAISPKEISEKWTNMAGGAVSGGRMTANQMRDRRPLPELASFKTPIDGLYMCGGCMHPGLGMFGAQGYVAAGAIARDLGVTPWWEK